MTGPERGFLLLTSTLGDPERKVLTVAQLRTLAQRVQSSPKPEQEEELTARHLYELGYNREMTQRIVGLLEDEELLEHYLARGNGEGCVPVTRAGKNYPGRLRSRLGWDAPGCLWAKGDIELLQTPAISLVGSRELREENRAFAAAVGEYAASRGLTMISGNARGADRTAQDACLYHGGKVISIVADELSRYPLRDHVVYVSEDDFDQPFSAQRALSRNRCIHAMGWMVFVAQAEEGRGGTWGGTVRNLRHDWSPVLCFRDGSKASAALEAQGAYLIGMEELPDFEALPQEQLKIF